MSFKAKTQKKTTELRELTIDVRTEANGKSLNNDRVKELFQKIQDTKVTEQNQYHIGLQRLMKIKSNNQE